MNNSKDYQAPLSDAHHYTVTVKRDNFIKLFTNEQSVDAFMATHLYGAMTNLGEELSPDDIDDFLNTSQSAMNVSFVRKVKRYNQQAEKVKKLSNFETYIALIKGYCVLSVLLIPKAFSNGGWGISAIFLVTSGYFSLMACLKLVDVGLQLNLYSYPLAVEKALGKNARIFIDIAISLTQFSFAISHVTFLIEASKNTVDTLSGGESAVLMYAMIVLVIYTMLSLVRNLAVFSFTFLIGTCLIIITCIFVAIVATGRMISETEIPSGIVFINTSGMMNTLGFTIYCYEGIGIVMPVLATSQNPQDFKRMVTYAYVTLIVFFISFAEVCYFAWGDSLDPYVTENLNSDNVAVILIKFAYSLNLVCSYPICIFPTNIAIENWLCSCLKQNPKSLYWAQNFSRLFVTAAAIFMAIVLASKVDKFLGLVGSLLCAPLAMTFPALLHMKVVKNASSGTKAFNVFLLILSLLIFVFCTLQSVLTWNDESVGH